MNCAVIFGGLGFIGSFFAESLLRSNSFSKIYLFDMAALSSCKSEFRKKLILTNAITVTIQGDVRNPIEWIPEERVDLIANFSAIHREPGHNDDEYYETNLLGAENVCRWAEKVNCKKIVFTSSISPYGPSEKEKNELAIPVPTTAYGGSKLAAEKIHQIWQAKNESNHQLVIVRPGVVFGPGEGGNVSRLIKAVINRYFFYMGNRDTRKAGVYVKELCNAILWVLQRQNLTGERVSLFNMSMDPGPSIKEYVDTVCEVAGVTRNIPSVPYWTLLTIASGIDLIAKPFGIKHPFSPVRIRKLVRSNNITPSYLIENGYSYLYTLESAFDDWKHSCPDEWS